MAFRLPAPPLDRADCGAVALPERFSRLPLRGQQRLGYGTSFPITWQRGANHNPSSCVAKIMKYMQKRVYLLDAA
jgi:hypothetical protein